MVENRPPGPGQPGTPSGGAPDANDRMLAAIGYPIWIVALIALLIDGPKDRPFTRYHALQALGANVAMFLVSVAVGMAYCVVSVVSGFLACLFLPVSFVPFLVLLYYGYLTYTRADYFEIPVITDLMQQQGWLRKPM